MLRNRKEQETSEIKGVSLAEDVEDLELGRFESLENWVPGDVYSIKKKRGVAALSTDAITPTVPSACA